MSTGPSASAAHDPELARFLQGVIDLCLDRQRLGPDGFLAGVDELTEQFRRLLPYRTERALEQRLSAFARERLALVDDASEYALGVEEVLLVSSALGASAKLAFPALKAALEVLSGAFGEEGVPALFGKLLKHAQRLARLHRDSELEAWVQGVVNALPGD